MPESQHSPRHGDYTGRETLRLKAAHAEELAQRRQQIGLTDQAVVQEFDGVYDPKTQQLLDISEEQIERERYRPADDGYPAEEVMEVHAIRDETSSIDKFLRRVHGRQTRL